MNARYFIEVRNRQKFLPVHTDKIRVLAEYVLKKERPGASGPIELGVLLVNDRLIRRLNKKFLDHDDPTDVLAFPVDVRPFREGPWVLGDVVVSVQTAVSQAKVLGVDVQREVALYLVHGILHLLGYRDDRPALKKKMWKRQEMILKTVVRRPSSVYHKKTKSRTTKYERRNTDFS